MQRSNLHIILVISAPLVLVYHISSVLAQGNLVSNGGFDSDAAGWALSGVTGGYGYSPAGGNPGGCVRLSGDMGIASASQVVAGLTPGANYLVSGDYQKMKGTSPSDSFGVAVGSLYVFTARSANPVDLTWYHFSVPYTSTASSAILTLSSQLNGTGVSYVIDNVSIQVVPEPSAQALFGLGALFLAARRFRRSS